MKRIALTIASNIIMAAISAGLTASWMVHRTMSATPATLTAREFILTDETGRVGAKIAWEGHQPGIQLFDRANHVRSALFLEPNGIPDLYLYDQNNVVRAALNLFDSGVPNLAFIDATQENMVWLNYDKDHSFNTTFAKIGKDAIKIVASRRITTNGVGLRVDHTPEVATSH